MLPDYFEFSLPTRVLFGPGILRKLGSQLDYFGPRKAMLISDEVLMKAGVVQKVLDGFNATDIAIVDVFDKVPPNSTIQTVIDCAERIKKEKCDFIIGVGGGSVIDTAKVANLLAVKGGRIEDHMGAYLLDKNEALHPSIYIPTTAGTGSEVTKVAVIADPDHDVKLPFAEDQFLPQIAILDPELTVSMPGKISAATGMDALTHAIEAYVDKEWSPASDALALHAVKLITSNILQVCAKPEDLQARGAMLVGSFLAGVAFSHSMVGMVHGISHALGGVYHIPHGIANALVLPEVMAYNLESRYERFADLGAAMGVNYPQWVDQSRSVIQSGGVFSSLVDRFVSTPQLKEWLHEKSHLAQELTNETLDYFSFVDQWARRHVAQAAIERVRTLNRQLAYLTGMPLNLKDAGVQDQLAKLDQVILTAMEDGSMLYNPVEPRREAVKEIIQKIYRDQSQPLCVSARELKSPLAQREREGLKGVFSSPEMVYDVLGGFFELLKHDPGIGPELAATGLCIQFIYKNPWAVITIDARGGTLNIIQGDCDLTPEVTMSMNADFAHLFWHGKANLVSALTQRLVQAKGNVPKTLKLLPVLKPAYKLYPQYLVKKGHGDLVI